ncbi:hypothetical protein Patl1_05335 [Pistacia atlantica]|uniref:Uncharacterized protein n=1 Tax=Pistacia atlantica TaxID=434234 RepID=A0ACC1BWD7_9ROSI|nr:hypothetical protein Patl1_05335 [Pistacia atlantica]
MDEYGKLKVSKQCMNVLGVLLPSYVQRIQND